MKLQAFKTEPVFQLRPWGGRAMAQRLGKKLPDGPIGESWEISAHPNGVSRVSGGPLDGIPLDELVRRAGAELLGARVHKKYRGSFPLLVKLIDIHSLASVQVHPNDEQAQRLEGYPWGKTEAWYIIDRAPEARFFSGLIPEATPKGLRSALASGDALSQLISPEVKVGDCLLIPPGTVHAVGEGVFLLEIQQSSDITYRVYDWDRRDDKGNPRSLHLEKALQVIDFGARPKIYRAERRPDALCRILACDLFVIDEIRVSRGMELPGRPSCTTGTVIEGDLRLVSEGAFLDLHCGDSFVIPAQTAARVESLGPPAAAVLTEIV